MPRRAPSLPPPVPARLRGIALLVVAGAALLASRLGYLQVARGEDLRRASEENRIHQKVLSPPRGLILDRSGEVLATTRPSYAVSFIPLGVPRERYDAIAATLARLLGGETDRYARTLREAAKRPFLARLVADDVPRAAVARLAEARPELPGVLVEVRTARQYLAGPLVGHLLGYVAECLPEDLDRDPWYGYGDRRGFAGVESLLEVELRGAKGWEQVEADAIGQPLRSIGRKPPVVGARAVLTIDAEVQRWAAEGLAGRPGAVVVLDPSSGRVRALYSSPAYDPNVFVDGGRRVERRAVLEDTRLPLLNRALQSAFTPGSTFKVATLAGGLVSGRLRPETRFTCNGSYAGQKCWILEKKHHGHGTLDLVGALANSCNVYFFQAGERTGIDPIERTARGLGLGLRPRLGIGSEAEGVVPSPAWESAHVRTPDGQHWGLGDVRNTSIGQGYALASPIQLARMIGTAAMGGVRMRLGVVERVEAHDGAVLRAFAPEVEEDLGWDSAARATVREAIGAVVERGTAGRVRIDGLRIGGKTGTAQNPQGEDHAWFVAVAPLDSPTVAICVLVENGGGGSVEAAPIARLILERLATREGWIDSDSARSSAATTGRTRTETRAAAAARRSAGAAAAGRGAPAPAARTAPATAAARPPASASATRRTAADTSAAPARRRGLFSFLARRNR